jgi:HAD superfamily hydrolase (TIGR01490 family)
MPSTRPIALFDFDGTLTHRDTLLPFLRHCVGTPRFLGILAIQAPGLLGMVAGLLPNDQVKQRVLEAFFHGWALEEVRQLGRTFAEEILPHLLWPPAMEILRWHMKMEHRCFLVSASLDVYLESWAQGQGFTGVLCSQLEVSASGVVSGRLLGRNVFGPEKVARITRALGGETGSIEYAYGDSRGDLEMLALARYAWYRGKFQGGIPPGWMAS